MSTMKGRRLRRISVAGVTTVVALGLAGCGDDTPNPPATTGGSTSSTSSTSGASTPPTSSLTSTAGQLSGVPVYWIGESRKSFALFREFRTVPDAGGPVASAVAAMTRMAPLDPDYQTPWKPATRVTATQTGASIAVDLSADAISNTQVGSELAARAVQQLVYTATAAAYASGTPATTVTITIDGKAADAWGVVRLGQPTQRADMASVQAHAWVTSPQEGETLKAGKVTFTGFGTSFEANFPWKVTHAAGSVVASGATMGGTGTGGFGEVTFSATLTPGTYTVELATDDPSGGAEGSGAAVDTKRFIVK
jgi:hypothetical protein